MGKCLFLLPIPISEQCIDTIPATTIQITHSINTYLVERSKTARSYLKAIHHPKPQQEIQVIELPKHEVIDQKWLKSCLAENTQVGLMSESGLPCVADPGYRVVNLLRQSGWAIKPMSGPSSIFLALMASGLNGQQFTFHGYLPVNETQLSGVLNQLQKTIQTTGASQIFIETPYRNQSIFNTICKNLNPEIWLCVARDLTGSHEWIECNPIKAWKTSNQAIIMEKLPTIFILGTPFFK